MSANQEFLAKIYKKFEALLNLEIAYFKDFERYLKWMNFNDTEEAAFFDSIKSINDEAAKCIPEDFV